MAKELYKYNEEYEQTWEEQKKIIIGEKMKMLQEWDKKTRMEKIEILKQNYNKPSHKSDLEAEQQGLNIEKIPKT